MRKNALSLAERQPVAVRAAVVAAITAVVHVAVVYGLVDSDQEKSIGAAVDALGGLVAVLWAIRAVTPNAKVISRVTTEGSVVAGEASTIETGDRVPLGADHLTGEPVAVAKVNPDLIAQG